MKYTISLAVMALLSYTSAINLTKDGNNFDWVEKYHGATMDNANGIESIR